MALAPDPVRRAIAAIATRDGVTLDDVAVAFRDQEGHDLGRLELEATLAALRLTGEVYRRGDRYHTREVGGPVDPDDDAPVRDPWLAIDWLPDVDGLSPHLRELAALIRQYGPPVTPRSSLVYPYKDGRPDYDKQGIHIAFAEQDGFDPLAGFRWEVRGRCVRSASSTTTGEWTLIRLVAPPPNQPDSGPGWYMYGPDVTAVPLGDVDAAVAERTATTHVRAYIAVQAALIAGRRAHGSTGPIVPDHIRAAIHAGHVGQVGIFCDRCHTTVEHDFIGETRDDRFAAARRHLENRLGWWCSDGQDLCPVCRTEAS